MIKDLPPPQRRRNAGIRPKSCGTWQLKCGLAAHATNSSASRRISIGWPPMLSLKSHGRPFEERAQRPANDRSVQPQ